MRSKPVILVALLLAAFLVNLDTTMVNVALPAMVRQLHATTSQLQWVVDAYNLVFAALLLTCGSLSDRFGRKGMLLAGLAVVGGASLAGGFTTTPGQLITARAVMGLGAAMTFPATLSLISNVFTERRERARAIGSWGAGCWSTTTGRPSSSPWRRSRRPRWSWWRWRFPPRKSQARQLLTSLAWSCRRQPWRCWCSPSSRRPLTGGPRGAAWRALPPRRSCSSRSSRGSGVP